MQIIFFKLSLNMQTDTAKLILVAVIFKNVLITLMLKTTFNLYCDALDSR